MTQTSTHAQRGNHGNKYLTAVLLVAIAAGLFVATLTYLAF